MSLTGMIAGLTSGITLASPFIDAEGDARLRRTDAGLLGSVLPDAVLPDVVSMQVTGWTPSDPANDPFAGQVDTSEIPDVIRFELVFNGLVNPPGPIHITGPFDPTRFGPSPVYGYVEFNLDRDADTGGEPTSVAMTRPFANVARFGSIPDIDADVDGDIEDRFVVAPGEVDIDFATSPQFERSGADLSIALCGCWDPEVVSEGADPDGSFEAGDTWHVRGRFIERAQGFACLSAVFGFGADGPTGFGTYDPVTDARFSHNVESDQTTIEILFPATALGASHLAGGPVQLLDFTFGGGNHFSLEEALRDVQFGASSAAGQCRTLGGGWSTVTLRPPPGAPVRPLDPTTWTAEAIFGTTYTSQNAGALYAWTDVGFSEVQGDLNGDGDRDDADLDEVLMAISDLDGGPDDEDPAPGAVQIRFSASDFSIADLDGDGRVDASDIALAQPCRADVAAPSLQLDTADIVAAIDGSLDFDLNGTRDFFDVLLFLRWYDEGCDFESDDN